MLPPIFPPDTTQNVTFNEVIETLDLGNEAAFTVADAVRRKGFRNAHRSARHQVSHASNAFN